MKLIFERMKPYWKYILIIFLAHCIQAAATLLLPTYTSRMVDTGVGNQGFSYVTPIEIRNETYDDLRVFMTGDEEDLFKENFSQEDGFYRLKLNYNKDDEEMEKLDEVFIYPIASYEEYLGLSQDEKADVLNIMEGEEDAQAARIQAFPYLKEYPASYLKTKALTLTQEEYKALGHDPFSIQRDFLIRNGAKMMGFALLVFAGAGLAHFLSAKMGTSLAKELRRDVYDKVLHFSKNELGHFSTASLITRTSKDNQTIAMVMTMFFRAALFSPILAVGGIANIIRTDASMSWILVAGVVVLFAVIFFAFRLIVPKIKKVPALVDAVNLKARESLTGVQVIRAFGNQDLEEDKFSQASADLRDTYMYIDKTSYIITPSLILIADIMSVAIIWIGGQRMSLGQMQLGQIMSFISYTMKVFFSFMHLSMISMMIPRFAVAAGRIQEIMDADISVKDPEEEKHVEKPRGEIAFNHVSFKFQDADEYMLKDLDFVAEAGETTAIIGFTGSGKSTILNLIMRFLDVSEGSITLDGVDIRDLTKEELRSYIGYVPQEAVLFSGDIASNIAYADKDLDKERIERAAKIAQSEEFIVTKDQGYKTKISQGGSNLSGGQKQRLSIARAIAKDPEVYLFDDSFSAVDYKTDRALQDALADNLGAKTQIVVAQRISSIMDAEKILVLNEGKIEAIGRHEDLLEKSPTYRNIARSQLSDEELAREEA